MTRMKVAKKQSVSILCWQAVLPLCLLLCCCRGDEADKRPKCGVYLAPSSIPGAGLGMFAGDKRYEKGEQVTFGDTVIPISEYDWNNEGGPFDEDGFLWDEYTWNAPVFTGMDEEGEDSDLIMVASPGVGAAANSYLTLVNVEDDHIKIGRAVGADSPGLGANTIYYGRSFYAEKEIPPGGEIWANYGSGYFRSRTKVYGWLPLPNDFKRVDNLLKKYLAMKNLVIQRAPKLVDGLWKDFYDLVKSFGPIWVRSRVMNGFPDEEERISAIMQAGGSGQKDYNRSLREVSWLEENGQCMDNIKEGNSTNPDAGRGAFANRFIPKGGLVAPAPLIHIGNYNSMKVFHPKDGEGPGKLIPDRDGPFSFQLLMNYCFGHDQSTLLLCPYGLLTAFINHSHENPNTRIVWAKEMRHPDWKEKSIDEWEGERHAGLQIDFVALRDIEEDEEILIDYGAVWEAAWQEHAKRFVPRKNYIPAFELNDMLDIEYRTIDDVDYEVDNVKLTCADWYIEQFIDHKGGDCECRVLKKLGDDSYLVQLLNVTFYDVDRYIEVLPGGILWNVPSDAFIFVDLPYTRDHYDFQSFRHAMMIPDDMFPDVWKNDMK